MTARTIVITGASDGIGASAARTLSKQGERVVVVGRSAEKTERIANEIGADYFVSDFADLAQVRQLAAQLKEKYPRIDVLANNAGGIMGQRELTVDGHEKTFQINHLAPFLLTTELMDVLTASRATVINTSSAANSLYGKLDLDDLETANKYSANLAYGNAKLENILFTAELNNRYQAAGISTAAFHPGVVATNFAADTTSPFRFLYRSFPQPVHAEPRPGRGHARVARHGHARAGLDLRRLLRQAGAGEGQQAGVRPGAGTGAVGAQRGDGGRRTSTSSTAGRNDVRLVRGSVAAQSRRICGSVAASPAGPAGASP